MYKILFLFLISCATMEMKTEPNVVEMAIGDARLRSFDQPVMKTARVINPTDTAIHARVECSLFEFEVVVPAHGEKNILFTVAERRRYDQSCRILDWSIVR